MIDPEKLKLLAQLMDQRFAQLQTAQQTVADPQLRGELKAFEDYLRATHDQFQKQVKEFSDNAKAELEAAQARLEEAKKNAEEAAAQRERELAAVAARATKVGEIDPLLLEKLHSDLLEDFGNRDRRSPEVKTPPSGKFGEVWHDWPEAAAPAAKATAESAEKTLPPGVRPFARLIDPKLGEELRDALLAEPTQTPAPPRPSESTKEVWHDWPAT